MKKMIVLLAGALLLSGCANIFDSNYLGAFDAPPALDAASYTSMDPTTLIGDVNSAIKNSDPTFFNQLKGDATALKNVQDNLAAEMNKTAVTPAERTAQANAAKAFIAVTANSTETLAVANLAVPELLKLAAPGGASGTTDPAALAKGFFQGMTDAEVTSTLESMLSISTAMSTLSAATDSSTDFLSGTSSGDVTQVGVIAAAATALMSCAGKDLTTPEGKAAAALKVVNMLNDPDPTAYATANFTGLDSEISKLTSALDPTQTPDPKYAYLGDLGLSSLLGQ